MKKTGLLFLLFLLAVSGRAQEVFPQYPSPLDIPIYLSATFAELRSNSFHAGVDIKTQGVEGKNVYAVADGYVSRIGVSPYGYGNVVYITHNDGFTSVYAHLQRFNKAIAKYVKDYQYRNKSFSATIYPSKETFPIKAGDFIGYTGNSGGSGGPHLHYEIRHTASEKPVNPLYFGLNVADDVRPNIKGISVYPVDDTSTVERNDQPIYCTVEGKKTNYMLKDREYVYANGRIAFGINTDDQVGTSPNKNGPYTYELYLDDVLSFKFECDSFSYSEPKYINSLIDYKRYKEKGNRYVRTEVDPFNKLSMYVVKKGVVKVEEGDTVRVCFKITDYAGNVSSASFGLVGTEPVTVEKEPLSRSQYFVKADGSLNNKIEIEDFQVNTEKGTLFRDTWMKTGAADPKGCCSRCYRFGEDTQAVFKLFKVRIKPNEKWAKNSKMFIAYYDSNGKVSSLGGKMCSDGYMETSTRNLGQYALKIDSIAPVIKSLNFKENDTITSSNTLRCKISDDMTGIETYDMYANDQWLLGQYDAKNDLLYYEVDSHLKAGKNCVKIVVKDAVGNKTTKQVNIYKK
ncbi:MAG: M23 family metallopeptidase [Bacteroidales bacterium]|nr:M23 family metallopeptidase [Bacteroidales bacterium]